MANIKLQTLKQDNRRWFYIILGILINICLGTIYSWSVFRKPIEEILQITATQSGLPYMSFLFIYAVTMPIAGKYIDKYSPRLISIIGGVMVGTGWFLASFAGNIYVLTAAYGLIGGAGVGVVYGVPISVAAKWFPDKKGLAVGLTLLGFGLSPLITANIAQRLIDYNGPFFTFRYLGISFLIIISLLSLALKAPETVSQDKQAGKDINQKEIEKNRIKTTNKKAVNILKIPQFYFLWLCYFFGTFSGLMAIGVSNPVAEEIINLPAATAALTVGIFAVFNGVGRPLYGWLTDTFSTRKAALVSYILIILASLMMLNAGEGATVLYVIAFSLLWLNLGGWLAVAPAAVASFFGNENYSKNYGYLFTAYGAGAILGTVVSGSIRDWFGSYLYSFYPPIILSLLGIFIAGRYLKQ